MGLTGFVLGAARRENAKCDGIKDQEKASKYLKRSDLRMKTIVSVRMSSFVISLYALLPYKSKSER